MPLKTQITDPYLRSSPPGTTHSELEKVGLRLWPGGATPPLPAFRAPHFPHSGRPELRGSHQMDLILGSL